MLWRQLLRSSLLLQIPNYMYLPRLPASADTHTVPEFWESFSGDQSSLSSVMVHIFLRILLPNFETAHDITDWKETPEKPDISD
jgi:hypothetical protein